MFHPKSILITGASSGIGEALALAYAAPNIRLNLSGRNQERLEAVAQACRHKGAIVDIKILDVCDRQTMERWITEAKADLVIANAGISGGTGGAKAGESFDSARQIFDVNLNGVLNTIEPAVRVFQERDSGKIKGQIAIISSLAGFRGWSAFMGKLYADHSKKMVF